MAERLLILGGTTEARQLADAVVAHFGDALTVTTSLAGRTQSASPLAGAVRRGGFGGAAGLAAYLRDAHIDFVVDATHPFAKQISAAAAVAGQDCAVPLLVLTRPSWQAEAGDRWVEVDTAAQAATLLPQWGKRAFLTIGRGELAAFAAVEGVAFLVRLIEPPRVQLPLACELILGRGPFTVEGERSIIARYAIDVLVTKASGGAATAAKLIAARDAGIPVIMLRRPNSRGGVQVVQIEDAVGWLEERLAKLPVAH